MFNISRTGCKAFLPGVFIIILLGFSGRLLSQESIHQAQYREYSDRNFQQEIPGLRKPTEPLGPGQVQEEKEVFGFHPHWMGTSWQNYDFTLLTTLSFFGAEINGSGEIVNWNNWPVNSLISTAHGNGVRVLLTVILFNRPEIEQLLESAANQGALIENLVASVKSAGADGVTIDFEGMPSSQRSNFNGFIDDLAARFHAEIPGSFVAVAVPAVDWHEAFDFNSLAASSDGLFIMGYDYHWSGSGTTGPVSPLTGYGHLNVSSTVSAYLAATRDNAEKLILGLPWYGYQWQAESGAAGAQTIGTADPVTYRQAEGLAATYEALRETGPGEIPWYRYRDNGAWQQGWYDDSLSLGLKYDFANQKSLQGIGIWALGYEGGDEVMWDAIAGYLGKERPPAESDTLQLIAAYPNPFTETITIENISPPDFGSMVTIRVYDIRGQLVKILAEGVFAYEFQQFEWDGRTMENQMVPSGIYFIRITSRFMNQTVKVTCLR